MCIGIVLITTKPFFNGVDTYISLPCELGLFVIVQLKKIIYTGVSLQF
jgi:hypothetical protein